MSDQLPEFVQNRNNDRNHNAFLFDDNPPEPVSSANGSFFPIQHQVSFLATEQSFDPVSSSSVSGSLNPLNVEASGSSSVLRENNRENSLDIIADLPREPSFDSIVVDNNLDLPLPSCSSFFNNSLMPSTIEIGNEIPLEPSQGDELVSSTTSLNSSLNFQQRAQVEAPMSAVPTFYSHSADSYHRSESQNLGQVLSPLQNEQQVKPIIFNSSSSALNTSNAEKTLFQISEVLMSSSNAAVPTQSSFLHPSDPTKFHVDNSLLAQILDYGFSEYIATLAIQRTGGAGVEQAVNWVIDHSNASDTEVDYEEEGEENKDQAMGSMTSQLTVESGPETSSSPSIKNSLSNAVLRTFKPLRSHKMLFVANMGLKMGTGKLAAQVGHATLGVYRVAQKTEKGRNQLEIWRNHGEVKIVVKGQNTEQLLDLFKQAKDVGLHAYLVQDAGYTQIPPGSRTVLGIFGSLESVDQITGSLKLL